MVAEIWMISGYQIESKVSVNLAPSESGYSMAWTLRSTLSERDKVERESIRLAQAPLP